MQNSNEQTDAQAGGTPNFVIDWALANVKDISPNFRKQVNQLIEHTIATEKELTALRAEAEGMRVAIGDILARRKVQAEGAHKFAKSREERDFYHGQCKMLEQLGMDLYLGPLNPRAQDAARKAGG